MLILTIGPDASPALPALEAALVETGDEVIEYAVREMRTKLAEKE
jgi:hypothetical protein